MSTYRNRRSQLHRTFLASALEKTEDNRRCRDMATDAMEHQHLQRGEDDTILLQPFLYLPDSGQRLIFLFFYLSVLVLPHMPIILSDI
jgi:hypothetical protein